MCPYPQKRDFLSIPFIVGHEREAAREQREREGQDGCSNEQTPQPGGGVARRCGWTRSRCPGREGHQWKILNFTGEECQNDTRNARATGI